MKVVTLLFYFCLLTFSHKGNCQKKNEIGVALQIENTIKRSEVFQYGATKNTHAGWNIGFGGVYEKIFNQQSSAVLGVKYRKYRNDVSIPIPAAPNFVDYAHFLIAENFLTIPIQYKFSFPIFSISAGTSLDYFLSWKEEKRSFVPPLQSYDLFFDKKWSIGLLGSISKKLQLDDNIILEPVLYYNRMLSFKRIYFGGSVEIKYTL